MVASYVRRALGIQKKVGFAEQPAPSRHRIPERVSIWDQPDWKEIKEEFDLEELSFNQGDYLEIQLSRPWRNSDKISPCQGLDTAIEVGTWYDGYGG